MASGVPFGNENEPQEPQSRPFSPCSSAVGEIFEAGRAVEPEGRQRLHLAALDLRQRGRNLLGHVVDAAGDQVLHRRAGAAIRDVRDLGAHGDVEQHGADMRAGAGAGRAVLHLALVGLGEGDEFGERLRREIRARDQDARRVRMQHHVLEIGGAVVERALVERLVDGEDRAARQQQRVAVGRRLGDALPRRSCRRRRRRSR